MGKKAHYRSLIFFNHGQATGSPPKPFIRAPSSISAAFTTSVNQPIKAVHSFRLQIWEPPTTGCSEIPGSSSELCGTTSGSVYLDKTIHADGRGGEGEALSTCQSSCCAEMQCDSSTSGKPSMGDATWKKVHKNVEMVPTQPKKVKSIGAWCAKCPKNAEAKRRDVFCKSCTSRFAPPPCQPSKKPKRYLWTAGSLTFGVKLFVRNWKLRRNRCGMTPKVGIKNTYSELRKDCTRDFFSTKECCKQKNNVAFAPVSHCPRFFPTWIWHATM